MTDDIIHEAIRDALNGSAICFLGAGFSYGAKTATGGEVPGVPQLSLSIREMAGLGHGEDASLSDLADYCEQNTVLSINLRELLVRDLTNCSPSNDQNSLLNFRWRAVFTTNFDDVAEIAMRDVSPQIVTPAFKTTHLKTSSTPLYYLHGRARDVLEGVTEPGIVLSELNYLKLKERNRDLYAALENEVHAASRVFFIGYSMRDAEIASRLFAISGFKEKSIVITRPGETPLALSRLKKFGHVYDIGLHGLVRELGVISRSRADSKRIDVLNFIQRRKIEPASSEVTIDDVHRLILSGKFSYPAYACQDKGAFSESVYCVPRRKHVNNIFESLSSGVQRFLITSDLGNGKSTFLGELAFSGHSKGYDVVEVTRQLPEIYEELDALLLEGSRRLYLIDDLVRYRKVAAYIGARLPASSGLVVTSAALLDSRSFGAAASELGGFTRELDLNVLTGEELIDWDIYLERWGFWEQKIEESQAERIHFLRSRCNSENRSIIVSLFKTSALGDKIKAIVELFLQGNGILAKPFIAMLINSLCRNHVEWSKIVEWINIDESSLKRAIMTSRAGSFVSGSRNWFELTSAQLAEFILNGYEFGTDDIVDVYVKIVRETAYSANDPRSGFDSRENLKELMRFRFLTRLFSSPSDGSATISAVYHRISNVGRIRDNDQFWLQYAMAMMEVGDLEKAETFINTSLGIAKKKGLEYSVRQIIDQRARLIFRKNTKGGHSFSYPEVSQAVDDIVGLLNERDEHVVHPLRSSGDILEFIDRHFDDLNEELVAKLRDCLELMKSKMPKGNLLKSQKGETGKIRKNILSGLLVLSNW